MILLEYPAHLITRELLAQIYKLDTPGAEPVAMHLTAPGRQTAKGILIDLHLRYEDALKLQRRGFTVEQRETL